MSELMKRCKAGDGELSSLLSYNFGLLSGIAKINRMIERDFKS